MKSYKEKQYIVFDLDDGKSVKYDLSTGECIGKLGKPVKGLQSQLKGYSLKETIDSFEDVNYRDFLKLVDGGSYRGVTNIGTLLKNIKNYKSLEQIYSSGLRVENSSFEFKINDIPKFLIKFCKENDLKLYNELVVYAKENVSLFQIFSSEQFVSLDVKEFIRLITKEKYIDWNTGYVSATSYIVKKYNYNPKSLLRYIDNLMTYEALDCDIIRELLDYLAMVSAISPKFDKYPKNFLTTHRIVIRNYDRLKKEYSDDLFKNRINKELEYSSGDYKIIYPEKVQDIKDEAINMNHCVASYIDKIIDGKTNVLFLRKKDSLDKSLVTLEVAGNKILQARRSFNFEPSSEEKSVISKYQDYLDKKGGNKNVA